MEIHCQADDAYSDAIRLYLMREFPALVTPDKADLVELLTDAIVATGQVRNGPKPSPETLVNLRGKILVYSSDARPLPFVAVWGSEKPDWSGIDIAELGALKTLKCLNERVQKHYPPGVAINIRLEDASAPHLFFDNKEQARQGAQLYCTALEKLNHILETDHFIRPIRESSLTTEEKFNAEADKYLPAFNAVVSYPDNPDNQKQIQSYGWRGGWNRAQVEAVVSGTYLKLYPEADRKQREHRLARCLAATLARVKLGLTAANSDWNEWGWMTLSFVNPTPTDRSRTDRIFYKTMPSSITSNHIPPWRAKGYLKVKGEEIHASLTNFHEPQDYNRHTLTLERGAVSQILQADYVVLD
jgi:hypothetical protein